MQTNLKTDFFSVVLVGEFKPTMFHPYWLRTINAIGEEDVNLDEAIFLPDHFEYKVGNWMSIVAGTQRIEFKTTEGDKYARLRDLVISCLNTMTNSHIVAWGLNRSRKYEVVNKEDYIELGKKLAYLDVLNPLFKEPKLVSINIVDEASEILSRKSISIKSATENQIRAIEISMNFHRNYEGDKKLPEVVRDFVENDSTCLEIYKQSVDSILNLC